MQIIIAGKTYEIKLDNRNGGHFNTVKQEICISKNPNPEIRGEILLHEIIECLLTEMQLRYKTFDENDSSGILFSFNHNQFVNFISQLRYALKDFLKFGGIKK